MFNTEMRSSACIETSSAEPCRITTKPRPSALPGCVLRTRLGTAVWSIRQARGLSQARLALLMNTSRQAVSSIERGEKLATVAMVFRAARALSVDPDVLLRMGHL